MGIKIIYLITLLYPISISAQNGDTKTNLKKLALCECILSNYKALNSDTFSLNDISKSTYNNESNLEFSALHKLDSFVHLKTSNFYTFKLSHTSSQSIKNNEVLKLCIEFYYSRDLNRFIRKLK